MRKSVERNAALERPRQFACEDEYDYMLIESERDELEQAPDTFFESVCDIKKVKHRCTKSR